MAASEDLADTPQEWPVTETRYLHRDAWVVALREDRVATPDGATARRVVMEHPGAAVVLAVDDDERALVLWQYRHAAGRRFVEIPAGLLDGHDEEPVEVARRELREEAQLQATSWTHLASSYPSPGISAEVHHLFLARGLSHADRGDFELHHEEADMTTAWVPFADLYDAVLDGRVSDGPVIQCVLLARARGLV
ncbi:NUDIX domain-containing protein [Nocardioides rubriscoriae]|uniref:NUDIX domain-containing protein n=1 Tax=Nocardioides rubriscoriae TaxID=642762 RepID=UPI0011DF1EEE|nr:NUDIX hydrolase [Nocardioides rubriscoriae]